MSDNGSPRRPHLLRTTPRRNLAGWQLDIKPDPKIGRALANPARQIPERYGQTRIVCLRVTIRALGVRVTKYQRSQSAIGPCWNGAARLGEASSGVHIDRSDG